MINKNKTIGLILAYTGTSYGMNLQAFATQYIIESLGYKTEIIRIKPVPFPFMFDRYLPIYLFKLLLNKIKLKFKKTNNLDEIHKKNIKERIIAAQRFREKFLKNFSPIIENKFLTQYTKNHYYAVLIGSDQVWLPGFSFSRARTLSFAPKGVKRISYASSLGVSVYPKYCYHSAKLAWKNFDSITVREEEGKKIIKDICGINTKVDVVLDPTYLIPKGEWEKIIPFKSMMKEKYVLCFILGNNVQQQICARRFADCKKMKLISILSNESQSSVDTTFADQTIIGASPEDFINYIRGAEFVFTDSFHGIAFSLINNKQLFVYYRQREDATGSMSRQSRIDNILRTFDITDRLIKDTDIDWTNYQESFINYNAVNDILVKKRQLSKNILENILKEDLQMICLEW